MVVLSLLLLLPFCYLIPTNAVSAGCECITFDTTYEKEFGIFTSPNWPIPYEDNVDCLLYTFIGQEDEIVEITFDEFDVQKTNLECIFSDFVKLFLNLKEPAVNEKTPYNSILCGKVMDIDQTHYSSGSTLIFEFHSDWRRSNSTGFRGTYRFLKLFQTDGYLTPGTLCDYQMFSEHLNRTRGRFYSPQYPSSYPREVVCTYHFEVSPTKRVKIVFEQIRLQKGDLSCLNSPDVILVYDGNNRSSPVIGQLCNTNTFVELVSTGPELYIEFLSRSHFPGQGFKASYVFEDWVMPRATSILPFMESVRRTPDFHTTTSVPVPPKALNQNGGKVHDTFHGVGGPGPAAMTRSEILLRWIDKRERAFNRDGKAMQTQEGISLSISPVSLGEIFPMHRGDAEVSNEAEQESKIKISSLTSEEF